MQGSSSRKVVVVFLMIVTILLIGAAIFIAIKVQQNQAPKNAAAAGAGIFRSCDGASCIQSCSRNSPYCCSDSYGAHISKYTCNGKIDPCVGSPERDLSSACVNPDSLPCGRTVQIDVFNGTSANPIDYILYYSGDCPSNVQCGGHCTIDQECQSPGGGVSVRCNQISNTCVNAACPNNTNADASCSCNTGRSCGQTCGAGVGLCGDGKSECTFISGITCQGNENTGSTICVPNSLPTGWTRPKCNNDPYGNNYVLTASGTNPTQAQIQAACNPATATPTPTPTTASCPTAAQGSTTIFINTFHDGTVVRSGLTGNVQLTANENGVRISGSYNGNLATGEQFRYSGPCTSNQPVTTASTTLSICECLSGNVSSCLGSYSFQAVLNSSVCSASSGSVAQAAVTSTPTNTPTITFTPTASPTITNTPTISPTPLPKSCGQPCDPAQGTNACLDNATHTCSNASGSYRCTLNQCVSDPNSCQSDGCTPIGALSVQKSGSPSCNTAGDTTRVLYSIRIVNPSANSRTITVVDTLDPSIQDSYVQTSTISNGGVYSNRTITWTGLTIGANVTMTLTYEIRIPKAGFGVKNNTVVVTEAGVERGRATASINASCLPSTALISDSADRVLIGMMLLIIGLIIYRLGLYEKIGAIIYEGGAGKIMSKFSKKAADSYHHSKRKKLEDKLKK